MGSAVKKLQSDPLYSYVMSVPCLSHGLNLVLKVLLEPFSEICDGLFAALKKLFSKPSARRTRAAKIIL